jgi:hypothetical protein
MAIPVPGDIGINNSIVMKKIFTVVSVLALIGTKCQNKNDNSVQTAAGKLLTNAAWKRVAATGQIQGQPESYSH